MEDRNVMVDSLDQEGSEILSLNRSLIGSQVVVTKASAA